MKLKNIVLPLLIVSVFSCGAVLNLEAKTIPANRCGDSSPLYGQYPCVGGNDASMYYLDTASCVANTDGNVATLGCMIYGTGGGAAPGGGPAKLYPCTVTYKTYKKNGKREILLDKVITDSGRDITSSVLRDDDGFLVSLFWTIADYTGMKSSLD